jgi:hypothetical protein
LKRNVDFQSFVPWRKFSEDAVRTEDLDPSYCMVARAKIDEASKKRFCVGLYMYYDNGLACKMAEYQGEDFWDYAEKIFPTAHRATERRHWRGERGWKSLQAMKKFAGKHPETFMDKLFSPTYMEMRQKIKENLYGFGDYFTWKIADMQDRCFNEKCDFSGAEKHLVKLPIEGFEYMAAQDKRTTEPLFQYIESTIKDLQHLKAPPYYDRPLNIQELETVACMFHTVVVNNYKVGGDLIVKAEQFSRIPRSPLVDAFVEACPKPIELPRKGFF